MSCGSGLRPRIAQVALLLLAAASAAAGDTTTVPHLLAAPDAAEGKVVDVRGWLRPHVLYLFPSRELAEARDWKSALIVGDDPSGGIRDSDCPGRFVTITGTFRNLDPGIYGLVEIRRIELADGTVCWPAQPAE
ncbi:MAG TPA: hypothetical protein VF210_16910 [Pseudomonadales bacterium]